MSGETENETNFFFVPFGRERGGYLDLLGLSPDADAVSAAAAESQYRRQLDIDFRTERKARREQKDQQQITSEEFDAQVKQLEGVKTRRLAELSELKQKYETVATARRGQQTEGRRYADVSWMTMYQRLSGDGDKKLSAARLYPLPEFEPDSLSQIEERWVKSQGPHALLPATGVGRSILEIVAELSRLPADAAAKRQQGYRRQLEQQAKDRRSQIRGQVKRGEIDENAAQEKLVNCQQNLESEWRMFQQLWTQTHSQSTALAETSRKTSEAAGSDSGPNLASESAARQIVTGQPLDPLLICNLVIEHDLISLFLADSLWSELRFTNRDYWSDKLGAWILEADDGMPKLEMRRMEVTERFNYPCLHGTTNLAIDKLVREELSEVSRQPDRAASPERLMDFQAILDALQARAEKRSSSNPGEAADESSSSGGNLSAEDFAAFLEKLAGEH